MNIENVPLHKSFGPVKLPKEPGNFLDPEQPKLGLRDDGLPLLYPGRMHTIYAETEAGKSWLALLMCAQEIRAEHDVAYIDFEDSVKGIVGRLVSIMGLSAWSAIREHFNYIQPLAPLDDVEEWAGMLNGVTLAIFDGLTEALSLQGLKGRDENDIADFNATWVRPLTGQGTATCSLDHVVKNKDGRGKYATGSVHKINAIDGAAFILLNREQFGRGQKGHSGLYVAKDRNGFLRRHGTPGPDGLKHIADLVIDSRDENNPEVSLSDPEQVGPWKPTFFMEKISRLLEDVGEKMSKNAIGKEIPGNRTFKFKAIDLLVSEGYAEREVRGKTHYISHVKPYREHNTAGDEDENPGF